MRILTLFTALTLLSALVLAGCRPPAQPPTEPKLPSAPPAKPKESDEEAKKKAEKEKEEAEIRAERDKLSPEDRKLVDAQELCPIQEERLGAMGKPLKVTVKDKDGKEQAVFVCCKGCVKDVEKNPEKALAKVAELKAKAKTPAKE
jgi:hypothetical protein